MANLLLDMSNGQHHGISFYKDIVSKTTLINFMMLSYNNQNMYMFGTVRVITCLISWPFALLTFTANETINIRIFSFLDFRITGKLQPSLWKRQQRRFDIDCLMLCRDRVHYENSKQSYKSPVLFIVYFWTYNNKHKLTMNHCLLIVPTMVHCAGQSLPDNTTVCVHNFSGIF